MAQEEWFIKGHPELFKDNLDKWLFNEFGIMGGCCSAQKSYEYAVARMVAEKLQAKMLEYIKLYHTKSNKNYTNSLKEGETDNATYWDGFQDACSRLRIELEELR